MRDRSRRSPRGDDRPLRGGATARRRPDPRRIGWDSRIWRLDHAPRRRYQSSRANAADSYAGMRLTEPVPVGTTMTDAEGRYAFTLQPMLNSIFLVQSGSANSGSARVSVKPLVQLRHLGGRQFAVDVSVGAGHFFTSYVALEGYHAGKWRAIASGTLSQHADPGAITAVSSAMIRAAVKPGTKLRASMTQSALGPVLPADDQPPDHGLTQV